MAKVKSGRDSLDSRIKSAFIRDHVCDTDGHIYGSYTSMFFRFSPIQARAMIKQFQEDTKIPIFSEESQMRSCTNCGFFDYLNVTWA